MKGGSDAQRRIVLSAIWWDAIAGSDSPFFCSQFLICQFFRWCFPSFSRDQLCTIQLQSRHVSEDGEEKHLRRPLTPTSTKQLGQWHVQSGKKLARISEGEKRWRDRVDWVEYNWFSKEGRKECQAVNKHTNKSSYFTTFHQKKKNSSDDFDMIFL